MQRLNETVSGKVLSQSVASARMFATYWP